MTPIEHESRPPGTGRVSRQIYSLRDAASSSHHSPDFNLIRSEYLRTRVLVIGTIFTLLAPLWIAVDYALLPADAFMPAAIGRLLMTVGLLSTLIYAARSRHQPLRVRKAWVALLLIPAVFYLLLSMTPSGHAAALAGYGFAPLLLIACLGVFPLTLIESLAVGLPLLVIQVLVSLKLGQLTSVQAWQNLWLQAMLLFISLWACHSQVSTLLRLYRQASLDPLTQLSNRGHLNELLDGIAVRRQHQIDAGQDPAPVSMLMFDLDHFKAVNDTYGHAIGDQVLMAFSRTLRRCLPAQAIAARYGGEEFCTVLPGTPLSAALALAEHIRAECHAYALPLPDGQQVSFTVSIGATALREGETFDSLRLRADTLLYQAKHAGRDRIDSNE